MDSILIYFRTISGKIDVFQFFVLIIEIESVFLNLLYSASDFDTFYSCKSVEYI